MFPCLGGGCSLPVGALASLDGDTVTIEALLAAPDGRWVHRATATGTDPEVTGRSVAATLLAMVETPLGTPRDTGGAAAAGSGTSR